eukprot:243101-Hanusia_phi.AAC.2
MARADDAASVDSGARAEEPRRYECLYITYTAQHISSQQVSCWTEGLGGLGIRKMFLAREARIQSGGFLSEISSTMRETEEQAGCGVKYKSEVKDLKTPSGLSAEEEELFEKRRQALQSENVPEELQKEVD